ncbi:brachyurin-like [Chironomus tepperi]|uniref:brachyurin-like n=1 Tax=Chironomus tepperi TaxID=113505 RepID=UPI00391EEC66
MMLKLIFIFLLSFYIILCDMDEPIDPINLEYYQQVVQNRTVQQDIAKAKDRKIINGSPAILGQFDYYVLVYSQNKRYLCGGTLIKVNWVLTAGHCLDGVINAEVHFGIINRSSSPERILKIENVNHLIIHEQFDPSALFNDIALIYLEKMSSLWLESSSIGFIEPKLYDLDLTNQTAEICGFGRTIDNGASSMTLNYINIPIMDYEKCEKFYHLDENNICVSTTSGESPCNGDSGGGVVVTTEDNQKLLVGIVSFGTVLCTIKYPVVLTKVSNYIQWMEDKFNYFDNPTEKILTTTPTTTPGACGTVYIDVRLICVLLTTLIFINVNLVI